MKIGSKIKDHKVVLTDGSETKISELIGKKGMVLYFYPKDSTPGCTQEACDFRDQSADLKKAGFSVVGVSPDSSASHAKFTEKQKLNFPLIADTEHTLCNEFGVWQQKSMYGRTYMGVVRSTFLIDEKMKIFKIYEKVKVTGHTKAVLEEAKQHGK